MSDLAPITIRGAREHNLKNVSVDIPSQKLVVITGPSGSGKSSLAFDTIFAEGQRRYIESLSAYARQFLEQLSKPDVDFIDGLSPAVSIEQKTISSHPRSTVGTVTSIYDYMRLLYARCGSVKDPDTGESLKAHTDDDVFQYLSMFPAGKKIQLFASVVRGKKGEFLREFEQWKRAGFTKVRVDGQLRDLYDPILLSRYQNHDIDLLVDVVVAGSADIKERTTEALQRTDKLAGGWLRVVETGSDNKEGMIFSRKIASASSSRTFPELEPRLFSFNSPYGMCPTCRGLGLIEIKVTGKAKRSKEEIEDDIESGLASELDHLKTCISCHGARLREEALWVFFRDKTIHELCTYTCEDLLAYLADSPKLGPVEEALLSEIKTRLQFIVNTGVGYLSLLRSTQTLSGGEAQRIRLATQLGTELSGVLYVLDEPSIGLHPNDHQKLLGSLKKLRDLGNTVLIVEHDEETMREADYIIDMGPGAGVLGGQILGEGDPATFIKKSNTLTAKFLRGDDSLFTKRVARPGSGKFLELEGCTGNNLQNVDLKVPLGTFCVFTGVSGSGKSSLVRNTLEVALSRSLYRSTSEPLPYKKLTGLNHIDKMVHVDQKPIGRTPRSNPATYTGLFAPLRQIFAQTPDAQIRGYKQGTFSFNVKGGRCDACEGAGRKKIEMHFMPDVYVTCEACYGKRYRREVLEVRFKQKNISEVLNMTVDEAYDHFLQQPMIEPKLRALKDVGLGYITLGQSSTTLSGGEAQRIKLAKELSKKQSGNTIYFLDEPTTGLHFNDIKKLLAVLQALVDQGNTVVVIEHNMDVICAADWVVDIGPYAGKNGGKIIFEGTPGAMAKSGGKKEPIPTAKFVHEYFERHGW
jgi:excinuclease ABC subunit A